MADNETCKSLDFTKLPERGLQRMFGNMLYADIVKLRLVNKWFNGRCSSILNEKFKHLEMCIDCQLECNKEKIEADIVEPSAVMHQKILQILKSELKILMAVCGKYIQYNCYCFSGGRILDCYDRILYLDYGLNETIKNPLQSSCAMQLFLYNDEFMDYFEEKIEPALLGAYPTPVFALKVFDILDSCVHTNYHIITCSEDNAACQICAQYEILKPDLITPPPKFENSIDDAQSENLLALTRYVRNQVRWYNFFLFVDSNRDALFESKKRNKKYSKLCLNPTDDNKEHKEDFNDESNMNGQKFNKVFSRRIGNPNSTANISYALELICSKHLAPSRLDYLLTSDDEEMNIEKNLVSLKAITEECLNYYEFSMNLKIILPTGDNSTAMENSINMIYNKEGYLIKEKENEIPI